MTYIDLRCVEISDHRLQQFVVEDVGCVVILQGNVSGTDYFHLCLQHLAELTLEKVVPAQVERLDQPQHTSAERIIADCVLQLKSKKYHIA